MTDQHISYQQSNLIKELAKRNPKCVLDSEGPISGASDEYRAVIRVFEGEGDQKHKLPATLSISHNGKFVRNVVGEMAGIDNPNMPLVFSCMVQGYNEGAVDIAKMYKQDDVIEGKVFAHGLSVAWKESVTGSPKYVDNKKHIGKSRNRNAWHFRATIKMSLINIPDNSPKPKPADKSPIPSVGSNR